MFYISPSSFKLATLCPASAFLESSKTSRPAYLGDVFHKLAVNKVKGVSTSRDYWDKTKIEYKLTDDEVKDLAIALSRVELNIPEGTVPATEQTLKGLDGKLEGTPDLIILDYNNKKASIIDWKYGMVEVEDASENYQGMCYSVLVWLNFKEMEEITFIIVQPRTNSISQVTYLQDDLTRMAEWIEEKYDYIQNNQNQYNYGFPCSSCFKSDVCPEFAKHFKAIAKIETDKALTDVEKLKKLTSLIKPIENVIEEIKKHAKQYVDEHGELDCGDKVYTKSVRNYDVLDCEKIYEYLKDSTIIAKLVKFSKSDLFKLMPDAKKFIKTLEADGCIRKRPVDFYTFKKKKGGK